MVPGGGRLPHQQGGAADACGESHGVTPAAGTILKKMTEDIGAVRDEIGSDEQLVMLVFTPPTILNTSTELGKKLDVTDFMRGEITTKVGSRWTACRCWLRPARACSAASRCSPMARAALQSGGCGGHQLIIMPRSAAIAVSKTDNMRLFDPQTWQKATPGNM